jgi:phosphoglycerate dehydrogenase-like enzyme
MQSSSICYLVLSEQEMNDFLPHGLPLDSELKGTQTELVDPLSFDSKEAWINWLVETKPELLLTCWKTPPLPADPRHPGVSNLKYVCHFTGSVRKLVPRTLIEHGLIVTNWGSSISRTVAECGLLLILSELRRAGRWNLTMHRDGSWKDASLDTRSLFERKVGLHGFGNISRCLVDLLRPFNVSVSAFSPSVPDAIYAEYGIARMNSLEALFSQNDIIVELAPLTPKNHHIVNEALLRMIPDDGVFVNIGRGAVVDEAALARVAAEGRIRVGLDVYTLEPLAKDSPLRQLDNVTLLPHIAGPTVDQRKAAGAFGLANLQRFLAGEALVSVVELWDYDVST